MGQRGPKPAPTKLKILRGTRPDRINKNEPIAPEGTPDCPAHLDDVARAEWDRMAPILTKMRLLTPADGAALGLYCAAYSQWIEADGKARRQGMLLPTGTGGLKTNPLLAIAHQARAMMLRTLAEFGCTPSSRSRVTAQAQEKKDDLGEFLDKAKA